MDENRTWETGGRDEYMEQEEKKAGVRSPDNLSRLCLMMKISKKPKPFRRKIQKNMQTERKKRYHETNAAYQSQRRMFVP